MTDYKTRITHGTPVLIDGFKLAQVIEYYGPRAQVRSLHGATFTVDCKRLTVLVPADEVERLRAEVDRLRNAVTP